MNEIRHQATEKDHLYQELTESLEKVYEIWQEGNTSMKYLVPALCAIRLEAFINIAGKIHINMWNSLERKLGFKEKCGIISEILKIEWDESLDINKSAFQIFEIRNALVHPKMKLKITDKYISQEEYDEHNISIKPWLMHSLRSDLTKEKLIEIMDSTEAFIEHWKNPFLKNEPEYWLRKGYDGSLSLEPNKA